MFYVRHRTENLLVLGAPRIQELVGLFLLGLGLLGLGLAASMLLDQQTQEFSMLLPGFALGALGGALIVMDSRICFDRRAELFVMEHRFGERETLPLKEIAQISVHRMRDVFQHYEIVMRDGRRIMLGVTRFSELDEAARSIAEFAGVPMDVRKSTQDLFPY